MSPEKSQSHFEKKKSEIECLKICQTPIQQQSAVKVSQILNQHSNAKLPEQVSHDDKKQPSMSDKPSQSKSETVQENICPIFNKHREQKGRLQGKAKNTIGIAITGTRKLFESMNEYEKVCFILPWIVKKEFLNKKCIGSILVKIDDLIDMTENVPCRLYNSEVDLKILEKSMERNAYEKLLHLKEQKDILWICGICEDPISDNQNSIGCDHCLHWMHFHCVGIIKAPPKKKTFFLQKLL